MILPYLFYFLIFIFVFGQLGRLDLGNGIVLHVGDFYIFLLTTAWIINILYKKRYMTVLHNYLLKPIILFLSVCIISLILNSYWLTFQELFISALYLFRWVCYAGLFFVVQSFPAEAKKRIFYSLIISQVLLIIFGFLQYFFYPNLRNLYYLGWDDHLYRLFSTFLDPNFAASQISLFFFLLLTLLLNSRLTSKMSKLLIFLGLSISFIAILLTYSRSGWLMLAVGSVVILLLLSRKKLILLIFGLITVGIVALPKNLHSEGVEIWRTASIQARSTSAQQAIQIISDRPLFGVGFNTYRYVQKKYGFIAEKNSETSHSGAGTDNSFLFVFATTGILGLLAYLNIWFAVINKTYTNYKSSKAGKWLSIVILSSIIGLFIDSLFINALFYPSIMFWMWTMIGLADNKLKVKS